VAASLPQLAALQGALRAGVDRFVFEGAAIRLLPSCGVFVTMNPGYAGRTELPDNLQVMQRVHTVLDVWCERGSGSDTQSLPGTQRTW
jgi:hypothetical protein